MPGRARNRDGDPARRAQSAGARMPCRPRAAAPVQRLIATRGRQERPSNSGYWRHHAKSCEGPASSCERRT
eukprot:948206-Pyramimonas_sp.AAC.1